MNSLDTSSTNVNFSDKVWNAITLKQNNLQCSETNFSWSKMFCGNKKRKTQGDFLIWKSAITTFIEMQKAFNKTPTCTKRNYWRFLRFYRDRLRNFTGFFSTIDWRFFHYFKNFPRSTGEFCGYFPLRIKLLNFILFFSRLIEKLRDFLQFIDEFCVFFIATSR